MTWTTSICKARDNATTSEEPRATRPGTRAAPRRHGHARLWARTAGWSKARRGFSLIEVTITLVIISVVTAIAMPRYTSAMSGYRVENAAHRLVHDLERAREVARTRGEPVVVDIDYAKDVYQITFSDEIVAVDLGGDPYDVDIEVTGGLATVKITFNGFGVADVSNITHVTHGTHVRHVALEGESGRVVSYE